jgi:hypothetical protein
VRHTDWDELEAPVRHAIEARTGRVRAVRTINAGLNSQLAVVLDTDAGWVFVKGLRADHPGVVRQGREAMINPFVRSVAPRLLWHYQAAGWDVLAFEYIDSVRHADYRPGSPDLSRVIDAMHRLDHRLGLADTRRGVHRCRLLPDPGHGGWSQRQPGRGAGFHVPGLAAGTVRSH